MTKNALALALEHREAATAAKAAVMRERELRAQLLKKMFPDDGYPFGTTNLDLGRGYALKVEVSTDPKFDQAAARAALEKMRATGELGDELGGRLFRSKLELGIREFKKLPPQFAKLFADVVTLAKGSPSVELQGPG